MRSFQSIFGRKEMKDNEPEIKESREFTGIIKLIHGEELVGKILITEGEDFFVVDSPFLLKSTVINTSNGEMFKVDLVPWLKFAKDEVAYIDHKKAYVVTEADDRIRKLYNTTLKRYYLGDDAVSNKVDLTKSEGRLGSVKDARTVLENLYKAD